MKKKSIVLIATVVMLSAALIIGGTLAYFTDSKQATNTFTVGNVAIKLDEAKVDDTGKAIDKVNSRTGENEGNTYKLNPGVAVDKDPTVTNTGANDAYVRMQVTITDADAFLTLGQKYGITKLDDIFGGFDSTTWARTTEPVLNADNTLTYTYNYTAGAIAKDGKTTPLFTTVKLPQNFTQEDVATLGNDGFQIIVTAQAIQANGFDSADAAFTALATAFANP